jgi:molybdate transport system ATP-binding protein
VSHQYDEVLRLATHVALMSEGRSVAVGPVEELSLHPQLRAIVGPDAIGAVLTGVVEVVDEQTGFAVVQVGNNAINLNLRGVRPGAAVRMHLHARDLILATVRPDGLSVRNVLLGTINQIVEDDADTDLVYVDLGGAQVLARVTRAASVALSFRQGLRVWVLVKSVSIRGHSFVSGPARIGAGHSEAS